MKSVDAIRELGKHTEPCIWTADDVKSAVMIEKETFDKCLDNIEREVEELRDRDYRNGREDAKLRELVRVFYHCTTSGECDECPINGGGPVHLMPDTICDTIHDRMRELGVEV